MFPAPRLLLMILFLIAGGCGRERPELPLIRLTVGGHPVTAELADTPATRERGLQERTGLGPDTGMLFVHPVPVRHGFWMKNTPLPLEIAFINRHGMIIEIQAMEPYREEPGYTPAAEYSYALEMESGWFGSRGIVPGSLVKGLEGLSSRSR